MSITSLESPVVYVAHWNIIASKLLWSNQIILVHTWLKLWWGDTTGKQVNSTTVN